MPAFTFQFFYPCGRCKQRGEVSTGGKADRPDLVEGERDASEREVMDE